MANIHLLMPDQEVGQVQSEPRKKREITFSAIAFPYVDLDGAITVARAMLDAGGQPCARDQLAGIMKQSVKSGNFVIKTGAAKMFGLIETVQGHYKLTPLGFSILEPARAQAAKAEAFLNVPLYRKAYDEFRGKLLPPRPHGLENAFVEFGVSAKQKDNARQVFDRSAAQAGFLAADKDKLIAPIIMPAALNAGATTQQLSMPPPQPLSAHRSAGDLDPLIEALLTRLPKAGNKWDMDARVRWLQTLAANLDLVYPCDQTGAIKIAIQ